MNKLKDKFHLPKAKSCHEVGGLESILRDTIYLAWPATSFSEDRKDPSKRYLQRQPEAIEEEDSDDDNE